MRLAIPVFLVSCWLAACVLIKFEPKESPPPSKDWSFTPMPEIDPSPYPKSDKWTIDPDGCCIENEDETDLKKGPYQIKFADWINPVIGWNITHYELINQWGDVVVKIQPNKSGVYSVRGVASGCYTLRAIGRGSNQNVPSVPSPEACTPGLTSGRIWT